MTIYEIKTRTAETSPYFFSRQTLKFFGQTMASFSVRKMGDFSGRYIITAPMKMNGRVIGQTCRVFNPENNKLEFPENK